MAVGVGTIKVGEYNGITVVRDDLVPGGTKQRVLERLMVPGVEYVYAGPVFGYAQLALAHAARVVGAEATIFVADRMEWHERTQRAVDAGAKYKGVRPGYLSVVKKRAAEYCSQTGATLMPWGLDYPEFVEALAAVAAECAEEPKEVWCVAGSGVLTRALQLRWPDAEHFAIQIGAVPKAGRALVFRAPEKFEQNAKIKPPFPSCSNYDAKAWRFVNAIAGEGALFWNVGA